MGNSIDASSGGRSDGQGAGETLRPSSAPGFIRRRFLAILIPLIAVPGAALAFSLTQDKEYEAETSLLFRDTGNVLASVEPQREAATNVRLLQLGGLQDRVEQRLGRPVTEDVDVVGEAESNLATIIVTGSGPTQAARVANAYAEEYIELRREGFRQDLATETQAVQAQLSALTPAQRQGAEAQALRARLQDLRVAGFAPSSVEQFNRAEPPSSATSPKPLQNTLIGALIGLGLGVALAIFLERRDRRVRDPRYIERVLGRPIIGRIPRSRNLAKSGPGTAALPPPEAEAFRTVRANLRRQLAERDQRSVLITSAIPREGKTTVVWNLARVEAASGAKVLVVEADMRRPVLAQSLGENGAAGLGELLAGEGKLEELIKRVSFEDVDSNGNAEASSVDVLFAGQPSTNPAELLDSERMHGMLATAPESYDLVVLDTPPTVVSDAMPILGLVGGVVVVGRLGLSTDESLIELREQLDQLDAPTLGVVVNGDDSSADPYHYYRDTDRT